MPNRTARSLAILGAALLCLTTPALAQLPPPPPPPGTLWSFLGIPQAYRGFRDSLNARGNRPGLERKPPMKAIADPNNLKSDVPAIKKAAEVKMAEDLAPQKIKAVKYLAGIGCGCYNRDGSITDALLKAMDDCSEDVRLQTIWAISEAAAGEACANCKQRSCCSEELSNKLYEIAYERDNTGCYLEPSERIRLAAAEALRTCCPGDEDSVMQAPAVSPRGGGEQPGVAPEGGGERPGGLPPLPPAALPLSPVPSPEAAAEPRSSRRTATQIERPIYFAPASTTSVLTSRSSQPSLLVENSDEVPLPPIVKPDSLKRPPAAKGRPSESSSDQARSKEATAPADQVPTPPVPPLPKDFVLVAARQSQAPAANTTPSPAPQSTNKPGPTPATPADQPSRANSSKRAAGRTLPGAQFGTGTVAAIYMKEGVAMLEFSSDAPVPPGSILRTYHDFALTGKTAVCDLEVVRSEGGLAAAVARPGSKLKDLAVGDGAIVLQ